MVCFPHADNCGCESCMEKLEDAARAKAAANVERIAHLESLVAEAVPFVKEWTFEIADYEEAKDWLARARDDEGVQQVRWREDRLRDFMRHDEKRLHEAEDERDLLREKLNTIVNAQELGHDAVLFMLVGSIRALLDETKGGK